MKKNFTISIIFAFLVLLILTVSCGQAEKDVADKTEGNEELVSKTVYVVNYPIKYLAERISGGRFEIVFPAPVDEDPVFWMPDPETIRQYQNADLILLNGATYAKWIDRVTLPPSKTVNTSESFQNRYLSIKTVVKHSHGPSGEHSHAGTDFNTWMNPQLAIEQARAVANSFQRLLPDDSILFENNFTLLKNDLLKLDSILEQITNNGDGLPILTSHPVYGYFADRYNLNLNSRVWEPEEMPSDQQWQDLDDVLKSFSSRWMIWEGDPDEAIVAKLKDRGISSVVFYPCGNTPEQNDYLETMKQNAERLKNIFK